MCQTDTFTVFFCNGYKMLSQLAMISSYHRCSSVSKFRIQTLDDISSSEDDVEGESSTEDSSRSDSIIFGRFISVGRIFGFKSSYFEENGPISKDLFHNGFVAVKDSWPGFGRLTELVTQLFFEFCIVWQGATDKERECVSGKNT
ncbi:hypothetical protein HNY73_015395 [Argiope bruennichi]|uniref:Uncharacterized protein n=1 Tax=Argiope bruennichi TaxID=94029 RepID=A0A8T0ESH4_ARGBR|nr:hypothetical protein HNY73_015395 [Argiope bruennichi]